MNALILLVVVFVALSFFFEARRRRAADSTDKTPAEPLTADEQMPTQTGKFRVHEALSHGTMKTRPSPEAQAAFKGKGQSGSAASPLSSPVASPSLGVPKTPASKEFLENDESENEPLPDPFDPNK